MTDANTIGPAAAGLDGAGSASRRGRAGLHGGRLWVVVLAFWLLDAPAMRAAELVMFESVGCAYCRVWDEQIGAIYPLSDLGAVAPLRRVDVDDARPGDLEDIGGVVFTPTFVLIDDGAEVGRITGYIGEFQFWGLLQRMIAGLPAGRETLPQSPAASPAAFR